MQHYHCDIIPNCIKRGDHIYIIIVAKNSNKDEQIYYVHQYIQIEEYTLIYKTFSHESLNGFILDFLAKK